MVHSQESNGTSSSDAAMGKPYATANGAASADAAYATAIAAYVSAIAAYDSATAAYASAIAAYV